ncbi:MBL fold metallo-hydrolase [Thermodesulfobacteriota bacterium]
MERVTENIYVETTFPGCVVSFLFTKEGIVMVDTPMLPADALRWRDVVSEKGEVRFIINTEHHPDHITGTHFFQGIVLSSEETRREILQMESDKLIERARSIDPAAEALFRKYNYRLKVPDITFSGRVRLHLGDQIVDLYHMPGHTSGQTVVHIPKESVVIAGDNVFHDQQVWLHDCDPFQWLKALERIEKMDGTVIVPGHGEICDKTYIPELSAFIQEWVEAVKDALREGLTKKEAMDKISFLDRYPMPPGLETWGPDVQKWNVARLYDLLNR